jgi:hypothetical protein
MQIVHFWALSAPPGAAVSRVDGARHLAVLVSDVGVPAVPGADRDGMGGAASHGNGDGSLRPAAF